MVWGECAVLPRGSMPLRAALGSSCGVISVARGLWLSPLKQAPSSKPCPCPTSRPQPALLAHWASGPQHIPAGVCSEPVHLPCRCHQMFHICRQIPWPQCWHHHHCFSTISFLPSAETWLFTSPPRSLLIGAASPAPDSGLQSLSLAESSAAGQPLGTSGFSTHLQSVISSYQGIGVEKLERKKVLVFVLLEFGWVITSVFLWL
jgi:hypothetical protein